MPRRKKIYNEQALLMPGRILSPSHTSQVFSMAPPTFIQCTGSNCSSGQAATFINLNEHLKYPKCNKIVYEMFREGAPTPPPTPSSPNIQHPGEQQLVDALRSHRTAVQTERLPAGRHHAPYSTSESRRRTSVRAFTNLK